MGTPTGTPSGARASGDVGPSHAHMVPARSTNPMVGRDVLGAPRTRGRHGDAIRRAGRRGRRPLPRHHMVLARSTHPMVGRDVPGAPRTRGRHGDAIENATGTRAAGDVGPYHGITWCRPVVRTHGRARRPRRAAYMGTPSWTPSRTPTGARAAEDVGPYHIPMVSARSTNPMVGRDVLDAPRTRKRPRERHQPRGPPGTSAPPTRTWCRPVVRTPW